MIQDRDPGDEAVLKEYGFEIHNRFEYDDGTQSCTCVLYAQGAEVERHEFVSMEAFEEAASYGAAYIEANSFTLEERLGPYGIEWEREQEERHPWDAI